VDLRNQVILVTASEVSNIGASKYSVCANLGPSSVQQEEHEQLVGLRRAGDHSRDD
jgi:hypothetical protein